MTYLRRCLQLSVCSRKALGERIVQVPGYSQAFCQSRRFLGFLKMPRQLEGQPAEVLLSRRRFCFLRAKTAERIELRRICGIITPFRKARTPGRTLVFVRSPETQARLIVGKVCKFAFRINMPVSVVSLNDMPISGGWRQATREQGESGCTPPAETSSTRLEKEACQ